MCAVDPALQEQGGNTSSPALLLPIDLCSYVTLEAKKNYNCDPAIVYVVSPRYGICSQGMAYMLYILPDYIHLQKYLFKNLGL